MPPPLWLFLVLKLWSALCGLISYILLLHVSSISEEGTFLTGHYFPSAGLCALFSVASLYTLSTSLMLFFALVDRIIGKIL